MDLETELRSLDSFDAADDLYGKPDTEIDWDPGSTICAFWDEADAIISDAGWTNVAGHGESSSYCNAAGDITINVGWMESGTRWEFEVH